MSESQRRAIEAGEASSSGALCAHSWEHVDTSVAWRSAGLPEYRCRRCGQWATTSELKGKIA